MQLKLSSCRSNDLSESNSILSNSQKRSDLWIRPSDLVLLQQWKFSALQVFQWKLFRNSLRACKTVSNVRFFRIFKFNRQIQISSSGYYPNSALVSAPFTLWHCWHSINGLPIRAVHLGAAIHNTQVTNFGTDRTLEAQLSVWKEDHSANISMNTIRWMKWRAMEEWKIWMQTYTEEASIK